MNLLLNHHSDSENAPSAYSTVWKLQLRQSHDTTDGSRTLRVVRKLQIPNRCLQISEISETNVQMNFWQQCSVTNTDVEEEGCDACLTSWYDREVSFLSIPLALPPVTRNYLLLLLDRKLWLSVRSFKPTFNKWQVHFFFLSFFPLVRVWVADVRSRGRLTTNTNGDKSPSHDNKEAPTARVPILQLVPLSPCFLPPRLHSAALRWHSQVTNS